MAHGFKALIDTGATISAISSHVVQTVGLTSNEWEDITGVHGIQSTPIYRVALRLGILGHTDQTPFHKEMPMLRVAELAMDSRVTGYDVLLGMDFLKLFHLTLYNDRFILSN